MANRDGIPTEGVSFRERRLALIDRILDSPEKYTPREWGIAQLYFKCGLTHAEIARIFQVSRQRVTVSMKSIRRKALS